MHCHVDLYPKPFQIISECDHHGIRTLAVTTTPKAWTGNKRLTEKSKYVRPALGLHPELISERANESELFESYLSEAKYVGEVGLDGRMDNRPSLDLQSEVLSHILSACSQQGGKVLSLHGAGAWSKLLDLLAEHLDFSGCRAILHWFTGSQKQSERASEMGCYFSVNAQSFQSKNNRSILKTLPAERVLTETDGPFNKAGQEAACPRDVVSVVRHCAQLWGITADESAGKILKNFHNLIVR